MRRLHVRDSPVVVGVCGDTSDAQRRALHLSAMFSATLRSMRRPLSARSAGAMSSRVSAAVPTTDVLMLRTQPLRKPPPPGASALPGCPPGAASSSSSSALSAGTGCF